MTITNEFLSPEEFKKAFYTFVYHTKGALDNKYAVNIAMSNGKLVCFFTFASSMQEAFEIAKRAYQAASFPLAGVDRFVVWGICKSTTCILKGEAHALLFIVDWSNTN
ncbi:MAG TPA: hypothetical protein VMI10_01250 [Terriglobales bacterium]|nr:hypothetical protein [Terriglobales bacterium]